MSIPPPPPYLTYRPTSPTLGAAPERLPGLDTGITLPFILSFLDSAALKVGTGLLKVNKINTSRHHVFMRLSPHCVFSRVIGTSPPTFFLEAAGLLRMIVTYIYTGNKL